MNGGSARPAGGRPHFVVTGQIPDSARRLLEAAGSVSIPQTDRPLSSEELRAAVTGADVVLTQIHDEVDARVLDAAGAQLRGIANIAVGYNNIDVAAAADRDVLVTNTPGVLTDATADLAMALILAVTRRLGEGERLIRARRPWQWEMGFMVGHDLRGRTLGVVGLGSIGAATARRARAFGMRIAYSAPRQAPAELEASLSATRMDLDALIAMADVVSLHCPLTPSTRHLLDAARLATMKPDAYVVNTARGPMIDERALAAALRSGRIAGAALDVFEREPEVHPDLLELENVVLVPHLGSATKETRCAMAEMAAENALAMARGDMPPTPVRPRPA